MHVGAWDTSQNHRLRFKVFGLRNICQLGWEIKPNIKNVHGVKLSVFTHGAKLLVAVPNCPRCQIVHWVEEHVSVEYIQGVFFNWYPPKKLKYVKPRLGESTAT